MVYKELGHLHRACYNRWQVVRIQPCGYPDSPAEVAHLIQNELDVALRFHSYTVKVRAVDNRIYLRKERK